MSNLEHPSTPILCPLAKKFEVTQPVGDIGSWTWLVTVKPPNRIYSQWFCWDFPGLAPVFILDAYWFSDTRRASFIRAKVCQSIERGTYFNFDLHGSMRNFRELHVWWVSNKTLTNDTRVTPHSDSMFLLPVLVLAHSQPPVLIPKPPSYLETSLPLRLPMP